MLLEEFDIQEFRDPDGLLRLAVFGELDLLTSRALSRRLTELRAEQVALRLDLSELEFIDCSGVRAVIQAARDAQDDGRRFELGTQLRSPVRRLLTMLAAAHGPGLAFR